MKRIIPALIVCAGILINFSSCTKDAPNPGGGGGTSGCTKINWYEDADGDGLGNPDVTLYQCDQPEGYVEDNTDNIDMPVTRASVPIIFKITGETCYYCGDWGWQAWIDLSNNYTGGKGLSWSNYGTGFSNSFFRNQELNPTMDPIENMFEDGGGKPNFAANGVDYSTTANDAKAAADAFIATESDICAVMNANIEGDLLTVNADIKVFNDLNGEYYAGAYLIENNVVGPQSGPIGATSDPEHHYVMRGSLSSSAFGEEIFNGSASTDEVFTKTFSATIPSTYNTANFSYGIIIWKKNGANYEFVNAYSTQ